MHIQSLHLVADINGDGSYSMWEVWEVVQFIYRLPGNLVVEVLGHIPYLAPLLSIHASEAAGYGSLNGLLATTISLLFWAGILFAILNLTSPTVDDDADQDSTAPRHGTAQAVTNPGRAYQSAKASGKSHLPVSRSSYSVSSSRQRKRHRLAGYLTRHAR